MTADLQRIADATDIGQLAASYGAKLDKVPGGYQTKCLFHQDKTGSLRIHTAGKRKGKFKCFGCGAAGDCYDLVRQMESCDLPQAVRQLAADAGIQIDERPESREQASQRIRDKQEREVAAWYYRQEWVKARRRLNRAMAAGPNLLSVKPERWNLAGQLADFYGRRLRWIESSRGTAEGLAEFRKSGVTERQYRQWLCGDLRRYAACLELTALFVIPDTLRL